MKKVSFYLSVILLSMLFTLVIISVFYSLYVVVEGGPQATEILTKSTVYLFFLRLTGTLALICFGITAALGALRNVIFALFSGIPSLSSKKTAFWKIHTQWASSLGIGLASAHFTIYLLYELKLKVPLTLKLFYPNFINFNATSNLIFLSSLALTIFSINFIVTQIPGVTGKKWWKPLHILNYFGIFLVLYHALYLGGDSSKFLFKTLYAVLLFLALSGGFHRFYKFMGKLKNKPVPQIQPAPSVVKETPTPKPEPQPVTKPAAPTSPQNTPMPAVPTPGNGMPLHDEDFHVVTPKE